MPEHYSKSTVAANFWCSKCGKPTMHNVADGRRGSCHECLKRLEKENADRPVPTPKPVQTLLF